MTDAGIKGLCLSIDNQGMKDERVGQCKSINTLNIRYTKITERGIQIAFENLPELKKLFSCFPIEVQADLSVQFPQYSLTCLECSTCDYCPTYKIGSVGLAASMCSSVTKVIIELQEGITNVELLGLLKLKNLCELSITGEYAVAEITFEGGVAPLLKAFGKSLTLLKLEHFESEADIGIIFENCPVLSTLHLNHINIRESEFLRSQKILSKLKFLTVSCDSDYDPFPSYYLTSLLSSPELSEISIRFSNSLTDQVLLDAAKRNQFCKLEELEIVSCHNVRNKGIDIFFSDQNSLKVIHLTECKLITKDDEEVWGALIKDKNWQLNLNVDFFKHYPQGFN